jgi:Ribonuclease G/E
VITIAISVKGGATRIALLKGDSLSEYSVWHFNQPGDIGDLYAGRITAKIPAMAGSFVDLGSITGFLPDSAGAGLAEGSYLAAEITRCAQAGKGPRLAARDVRVEPKPGLIRQSLGPLGDLAARFPDAPIRINDYGFITALSGRCKQAGAEKLAARISYKAITFDPVLEDEIATLLEPSAALAGGASMHITPTPALIAIDIDAGSASADKNSKQQSQLSLNTALIPEITRQILLRNLSGAILIDFAGMKSSARPKLLPALNQALQSDPLSPKCLGFSHLGFAEISRPRVRPALHEFSP